MAINAKSRLNKRLFAFIYDHITSINMTINPVHN